MARTITDEAYKHWLSDTTALRVILGEFGAYKDGSVVTHRVGTEYFTTSPTDTPPNTVYTGSLIGAPTFTSRATENYGGSTFVSFGNVTIDNTGGLIDEWILQSFAGRPAILKLGAPEWNIDDFRVIFNGVSDRIDIPNDGSLDIYIKDKQRLLDAPVQVNRMNETEDEAGVLIPLCYGTCFNISPVLDSENERRYVIHDGPIASVDAVYINGVVSTAYSASLPDGWITLNADPEGAVTCDVKGDYNNTIPSIAAAMVARVIETPTSYAKLPRAWETAVAGLYITDRTNLLDALDSLGTGFRYGFDRLGEFSFAQLEDPSDPVVVIDGIETYGDLGVIKGDVPIWKVSLGYKKNHTEQKSIAEEAPDAHRSYVAKGYTLFAVSQDASVKEECIIAQEPEFIGSVFITKQDAVEEAERIGNLFKKQRYFATVSAYSRPLTLSLGDTITVVDGRFGMQDGVDFVVMGTTEHLIDSKVDLELWR
jgi:hypothetical protein